ncbi:MAG: peptidylprolyl isomerase [Lactobacillus sp.]|jgi:peptidyl-prolyl cis-trans isomerase B (cyclophilin B)|uniref:peptidylprolyl isomerase n=1 Tax=Lactobacillus equicursoris TaxID=420645 RepID=UPI00242B1809|nr:peptidylprolyl isomerase [Lactobacillus equicursoris]MDD6408116.1 peptidylprolyl isomerase [Lactobacillus equicursoris]
MADATFWLANGKTITVELLPEAAPNTCASFVWAVKHHIYDGHQIQRIVPGKWVDLSYDAFGKEEAKYLIPSEFTLHPELKPLPVAAGSICMGGYGDMGLAGCEVFFPLTDQPQLTGTYPVFGRVKSGFDEIKRLGSVPTRPVTDFPYEGVEVNEPIEPQVIERVSLNPADFDLPAPVRMTHGQLPLTWQSNNP